MRLLALDAALGPCGVALVQDGCVIAERASSDLRGATALLPAMVADLLAQYPGFDAVAVTIGPGSFTGIRATLSLAHGLALGAGVPVVAVGSAEAMAAAIVAEAPGRAPWVAIDTRRGSFYLARDGVLEVADVLPVPDGPVALGGDAAPGLALVGDVRLTTVRAIALADVARLGMARLAGALTPLAAQPLYVAPPLARPAVLRAAPA